MRCIRCRREASGGTKLCQKHREDQARRSHDWHARHIAAIHPRQAEKRWAEKRAAMARYGGGCVCCGESELVFLTLDHIQDDGAAQRRRTGITGGWSFYVWLRKHGYPAGYQVLCANCNLAKAIRGRCPHAGPMHLPVEDGPTLWTGLA